MSDSGATHSTSEKSIRSCHPARSCVFLSTLSVAITCCLFASGCGYGPMMTHHGGPWGPTEPQYGAFPAQSYYDPSPMIPPTPAAGPAFASLFAAPAPIHRRSIGPPSETQIPYEPRVLPWRPWHDDPRLLPVPTAPVFAMADLSATGAPGHGPLPTPAVPSDSETDGYDPQVSDTLPPPLPIEGRETMTPSDAGRPADAPLRRADDEPPSIPAPETIRPSSPGSPQDAARAQGIAAKPRAKAAHRSPIQQATYIEDARPIQVNGKPRIPYSGWRPSRPDPPAQRHD